MEQPRCLLCHAALEDVGGEGLGVAANRRGVMAGCRIEIRQHVGQPAHVVGIGAGAVVQNAGHAVNYRIENTPHAPSDHWRATCLRLHRDDAEVFFAGKYQRPASPVEVTKGGVIHATDQVDPGASRGLHQRTRPSVTGYDDPYPSRNCGANGDLGPLVGDEPACQEEEVLPWDSRVMSVEVRVHGRCDHVTFAAPVSTYAIGYVSGVCDDVRDAARCSSVGPPLRGREGGQGSTTEEAPRFACARSTLPDPPGRRVHICEGATARRSPYAAGERVVARDDEVVAGQVHVSECRRQEREQMLVDAAPPVQPLERAVPDVGPTEGVRKGFPVHDGHIDGRRRPHLVEGDENPLRAGGLGQPLVDERDTATEKAWRF